MSTWESVTLSPGDVESMREPTFKRTWRGYDRDEVATHLKRLMGRIRVLEHNAAEFESELEQMRKRGGGGATEATPAGAYETIAVRLAPVFQAIDDDITRIRGDAEREADELVEAARAEAERIRAEAEGKAEEVRVEAERAAKEASERADELLSGLESRRSTMLSEIRTLKERMLQVAKSIAPPADLVIRTDDVTEDHDIAVAQGTGPSVGKNGREP